MAATSDSLWSPACEAIRVTILGARGLCPAGSGKNKLFCACDIPGRPGASFQTEPAGGAEPSWSHTAQLPALAAGESLVFNVHDGTRARPGPGGADPRGEVLGRATLQAAHLGPAGFDGEVALFSGDELPLQPKAYLKVRIEPATSETASASDFTVQVDTFFGIARHPSQPAEEPHSYLLRAAWLGQQGGLRTEERVGRPGSAPGTEDCIFKQQLRLAGIPGLHALVVGLFRRGNASSDDELIGACKLDINEQAHREVRVHPLTDDRGQPTGARARMRLKAATPVACAPPQAGGVPAVVRTPPVQLDPQRDLLMEESLDSTMESLIGAQGSCSVHSPGNGGSSSAPVRKFSSKARSASPPLTRPSRQIWAEESPMDYLHELHALHEQKQLWLERQREMKEEEELQRMEDEREALRKSRAQAWGSPPNPAQASDRLYQDHFKRKKEEEERQRKEEEARQSRAAARSSAGGTRVGERLYQDHQRRIQALRKNQLEKEAREQEELDHMKITAGRSPALGSARHVELYEEAREKRLRMERMRQEHEAAESRKLAAGSVTNGRLGPANVHRLEELHKEHAARMFRRKREMKEKTMREEQRLQEEAAAARRWSPPRRMLPTVSMVIQNVDCTKLFDPAASHLLAGLEEALTFALLDEVAGGCRSPRNGAAAASTARITVELSETDGGELQVKGVISPPVGEGSSMIAARLRASTTLIEALADAAGEVEGIEEAVSNTIAVTSIRISEAAEAKDRAPESNVTAPPRSAGGAAAESASAAASAPRPPPELTTPTEYALAAIASAIQLRCSPSNMPSNAELRGLLPSLRATLSIYRDAVTQAERSEGYVSIQTRSSRRLVQGNLLPDTRICQQGLEPDALRQCEEDFDTLLATAAQAQLVLQRLVATAGANERQAPDWPVGKELARPAGIPAALFAYNPGAMARAEAQAKARVRYGPAEGTRSCRHVLDLARLTLVFGEVTQSGLDMVRRVLEVVAVRNRSREPTHIGGQHEDVYVVVRVPQPSGPPVPHICQLRLQDVFQYKASQAAAPHLEDFNRRLRSLFERPGMDTEGIVHLAHWVLTQPHEKKGLRWFRRQFARHFGSTVCGWRRFFNSTRLLSFERFKAACVQLKCIDHAAEYWSELEAGLGGTISLFEFDPEAATLLVKLHVRLLALADCNADTVDDATLFKRFSFMVRPRKPGHLDIQEFRIAVRPLGLTDPEAVRAFSYLDYQGGMNPPATITAADLGWLKKLRSLLDLKSTLLSSTFLSPKCDESAGDLSNFYTPVRRDSVHSLGDGGSTRHTPEPLEGRSSTNGTNAIMDEVDNNSWPEKAQELDLEEDDEAW